MLVVSAPGVAHAASPDRAAVCDGYAGDCTITSSSGAVQGQTLKVTVNGNRVPVTLQVYRVEFNRAGELTALVEMGEPRPFRVDGDGSVGLRVMESSDALGGWAYVGLADEKGLEVTDRLGVFVGFGGTTLTLLGDGYAEQKPVGADLDMQVLGHVPEIGYWVEYRDDTGAWQRVPGQGQGTSQQPGSKANEIGHLSYSVPPTLVGGRSYAFRTNTHLNYAGGKLISQPAFATWTVIPSENPATQERGRNFDPANGTGLPDPLPDPSETPTPTGQPTPQPTSRPSSKPTGTAAPSPAPSPAPSQAPAPSATPSTHARTPSSTSSASPSSTPLSTPSASTPPPTSLSPSPAESASPSPASPGQVSSGTVWGEEETADVLAAAAPVDSRLSGLVAFGALLLVLAPALWWVVLRARGTARDREEAL